MQNDTPSPSHWNILYVALAGFLGFLARQGYDWIVLFLNRNKPAAEIHESQARAELAKAQTRRINLESDSQISEIIMRMTARLAEMQDRADEINTEREQFRMLAERQRIELKFAEVQIKRLKGILDANSIKVSDYDELR